MDAPITPTREEVLQELERVLKSKELRATLGLRALLKYMVSYSLNGEEKGGKEIASVIFPASDPDSSNVKVNVSSLRSKLESYFGGEGSQDFVRIELPVGRTYKASFAYRYKPEALRLYERAISLMGADGHPARLQAKQCFDLAILEDRSLGAAYVSRLQLAICDGLIGLVFATKQLEQTADFERPLEGELETLEANPGSSSAWCLHGIARLIGGQRAKAVLAFEKAVSLDSELTWRDICYGFYLLLTGHREEALKTAEVWDESPVDERTCILRGLFFYLAGKGTAAVRALRSPRVLAPEMIAINLLVQGLAYLNGDAYDYSSGHRCMFLASCPWDKEMERVVETDETLKHEISNQRKYEIRAMNFYTNEPIWIGYEFPDFFRFPGFNILALAKVARPRGHECTEAMELLEKLQKFGSARSLQLAVACLAVDRKEEAVRYLHQAVMDGDVFALHYDYWPFLAELNGYPAFEQFKESPRTSV